MSRLSGKNSLSRAACVIRRFLLLTYLSTLRAKSGVFLGSARKSYSSPDSSDTSHPPALRSGGVKVALPNSEEVSHYEYQYIE